MNLIAVVVLGIPLGLKMERRRSAFAAMALVWLAVLPIQTIVVRAFSPDDINAVYWVANLAILGLGIALVTAGARIRARRHGTQPSLMI